MCDDPRLIVNAESFLEVYEAVMLDGELRYPRGQACRDLRNYRVRFSTTDSPCSSFIARKFNLLYAKKELQWYLDADPKADWIQQYATAWKKLQQPDGSYYSNYGQYLFNYRLNPDNQRQIDYLIEELTNDSDSRRAVMVLLQPYHLFRSNIDTVCTYAMHFSIHHSRLHMTVLMRSNDAIWGLSNDAFCFWNIYQMVYALLKEHYPHLERGVYDHIVNSMHIYSRHYEMAQEIIDQASQLGISSNVFQYIKVPYITAPEVRHVLGLPGETAQGEFLGWLTATD